jgi:hypothetical protein
LADNLATLRQAALEALHVTEDWRYLDNDRASRPAAPADSRMAMLRERHWLTGDETDAWAIDQIERFAALAPADVSEIVGQARHNAWLTADSFGVEFAAELASYADTIERLAAALARVTAERDRLQQLVNERSSERDALALRALAAEAALDDAEKRLCVACGKNWDASTYKHRDTPSECPTPDACMLDMTAEEGFDYWRNEAHRLQRLVADAEKRGEERMRERAAEVADVWRVSAYSENAWTTQDVEMIGNSVGSNIADSIRALTPQSGPASEPEDAGATRVSGALREDPTPDDRPWLTRLERELLEEVAGLRPARPWGAAVDVALESLAGMGLITRPLRGVVTYKGRAALASSENQT